jgi:hypothetical protein
LAASRQFLELGAPKVADAFVIGDLLSEIERMVAAGETLIEVR